MSFDKSLGLQLKSSKSITLMVAILHVLVLVIVLLAIDFSSVFFTLFLILTLVGSFTYYYQWHGIRILDKSIIEIGISSSGDWSVVTSIGKRIKVIPLCTSFVSQYLMILNFSSIDSGKYYVLVTKKMLNKDEFRHLIVRLRTAECMSTKDRKNSVLDKLYLIK